MWRTLHLSPFSDYKVDCKDNNYKHFSLCTSVIQVRMDQGSDLNYTTLYYSLVKNLVRLYSAILWKKCYLYLFSTFCALATKGFDGATSLSSCTSFIKDMSETFPTIWPTDYGHTMAKFIILCGPNTLGYKESKSMSLKSYYSILFWLEFATFDQWTQYFTYWDRYEVTLSNWKQVENT